MQVIFMLELFLLLYKARWGSNALEDWAAGVDKKSVKLETILDGFLVERRTALAHGVNRAAHVFDPTDNAPSANKSDMQYVVVPVPAIAWCSF